MRPVRLEVEGFMAFRQPVVIDFAGADLFALVGPTGAGKTSIIDAITFALYGTIPRLDDRRAVAPIVSQNLTEARVRLDFAVGSERYTAVRVVRASKTGASTKEARLQRGEQVLAGNADEVSLAVVDLLGLTYEHFTTCVSLPQGQFARFLHDKPRDRQDLLVRLLELGLYDLVASASRQRAALAATRAEVLDGQLERLAEATPEARDEARAQVDALTALGERLARVRPELDELDRAAGVESDAATHAARQLDLLQGLQLPAGVDELSEALTTALRDRQDCLAAEEAAATALAAAEQRLAGLPPRRQLEQVRDDLQRRDELQRQARRGREAVAVSAARVEEAQRAEAEAEQSRDERAAALERVRVEQRASALVPELQAGEPCPVCRQPVSHIPEIHLPDLAAVEQALATATQRLRIVSSALSAACTEQARVEEKLAGVEVELAVLVGRLAASPLLEQADEAENVEEVDGVDGVDEAEPNVADGGSTSVRDGEADAVRRVDLGAVESQLAEVGEAEAEVTGAREGELTARRAIREADRRHFELVGREAEARQAFDRARDAVAALEPPATERHGLAADWAALVAWAERRRPRLYDELEQHRRDAAKLQEQAAGRLVELTEACCDAGVVIPGSGWPGEAVAAARARAEQAAERLDQELAEAEHLRAQVRAATEQRQVAEAVANHLAANRFEKWLLDEAVHRLVERASVVLGELSGDAYALSVDDRSGAFTVIDHANASQARPARTLSGGETFLASLALALALADQVAELAIGGVARLEALFLDEGFGTLDADALDIVATALDELGARGRMVGIVTHVRELADRLPLRFEVSKVAGTATVERVET